MTQIVNSEFIERYQLEYQKNPRSRVFAPLAEGYRKLGLLEEAFQVAQQGVKFHPEFAGGRVALAKVLLDRKEPQSAVEHLQAATRLSPDNLLAHSLLGETWLQLRRPKEALKSFKMVLFIDPQNERALANVKKWEFLTADEYGDEAFEQVRVQNAASSDAESPARERERAISLADALTVRNDPDRALEILREAQAKYGEDPELRLRLSRLKKRLQIEDEVPETLAPKSISRPGDKTAQTIALLQSLLRRIEERSS